MRVDRSAAVHHQRPECPQVSVGRETSSLYSAGDECIPHSALKWIQMTRRISRAVLSRSPMTPRLQMDSHRNLDRNCCLNEPIQKIPGRLYNRPAFMWIRNGSWSGWLPVGAISWGSDPAPLTLESLSLMPLGLAEYLVSLEERSDLIWPQPPPAIPLKARPFIQPLTGIRLVTFSVYGTLLEIDGGTLVHRHPQELRMQIALEKTIKEFNMWNSMTRKAGQPWEAMLRQYQSIVEEVGMAATRKKGDVLELDSRKIWKKILQRLQKNEYNWDAGKYGDLDDLSAKVAYFFHASLQGTSASPETVEMLEALQQGGLRCGIIADGQIFTLPQLFQQLKKQSPGQTGRDLLAADCIAISWQIGVKKPSETLYRQAVSLFAQRGISPGEVLHVSHRLADDLAVAKKSGFHTALYAADKNCCRVQGAELKQTELKPDRLITQLSQLREILSL